MFPLIRTLDFLQDGAADLPDQHLPDANLGVGLGAVEQRAVGAVDLHESLHDQRHPELGVARERQGTTGGTDRKQIVDGRVRPLMAPRVVESHREEALLPDGLSTEAALDPLRMFRHLRREPNA